MMNYTIGQVAKMKNLSISQLRYYDQQGLFPFLKRTEKGDRVFTEDALNFLDFILCLKNTGMPIKEIQQFVELSMIGKATNPQRIEMMRQQETKLIQQIQQSQQHLIQIQQKINRLKNEMEAQGAEARGRTLCF